jgi:hypothetical protein
MRATTIRAALTGSDARATTAPHRSCRSDRATAVAAALIQITITVPRQQRPEQFENYLRDEFWDECCQAVADREPVDA